MFSLFSLSSPPPPTIFGELLVKLREYEGQLAEIIRQSSSGIVTQPAWYGYAGGGQIKHHQLIYKNSQSANLHQPMRFERFFDPIKLHSFPPLLAKIHNFIAGTRQWLAKIERDEKIIFDEAMFAYFDFF